MMNKIELIIFVLIIICFLFWVYWFIIKFQTKNYTYNNKNYRVNKKEYTYDCFIIKINGVRCSDIIHYENINNDRLVDEAIKLYIRKKSYDR